MILQGKVALVTGGSRGIGRAVALALARHGARVALTYVHAAEAAEAAAAAIRAAGSDALAIRADVRSLDEVKSMATQAAGKFGPIDILVNNAGIIRDNYLTFMKEEEWNDVLDTDLKGAFYCIKVVGKDMMKQKAGRIINVASDAGLMGDLMRANYASAKAGLLGLTKTAAREFAAHGITVNAVSPGIIETDLIAGLAETRRSKQLQMIPQARFGKPEEVANAIVFLASDDASYITGEVLCVDGGLHTR
jgi:3-oxoacyl-[acyl-carrier protein] reductase